MKYNVSRAAFDKIFLVNSIWSQNPETHNFGLTRKFINVELIENGNYISFSKQLSFPKQRKYSNKTHFEHCLGKLGFVFVNLSKTSAVYGEHRFYVAPEYWEMVKNLFDLAHSEVPANVELAFCMFQNIKSFASQTQIEV